MDDTPCSLEARRLHLDRGGRPLLADLSLTVQSGETLLIQGPNGVGKTSLIKILCGLLAPDAGGVFWRGRKVSADAEGYRASLRYVGHKNGMKNDLTPYENLLFAGRLAGAAADPAPALERWGLAGCDRPCRTLSAGQRRRTALATLLLRPARLWLLDEPLAALDEEGQGILRELARGHLAAGGLIAMSTHQPADWAGPVQRLALAAA